MYLMREGERGRGGRERGGERGRVREKEGGREREGEKEGERYNTCTQCTVGNRERVQYMIQ